MGSLLSRDQKLEENMYAENGDLESYNNGVENREVFTREDAQLTPSKAVYCSGPHKNPESQRAFRKDKHKRPSFALPIIKVAVHVFTPPDYHKSQPKMIPRWSQFRYIERNLFTGGTRTSLPDIGVITLQNVLDEKDYLHISWDEFTENFTPYNEEQSKSQEKGSYFMQSSWTAGNANLDKPRPQPYPDLRAPNTPASSSGRYHSHHHRSHRS